MLNESIIAIETSEPRWLAVLRKQCEKRGQGKVATDLKISKTMISQALNKKYPGDLGKLEQRVRGAYLGDTVNCPILGELETNKCLNHQRQSFTAVNPIRVQLYRACNCTCPHSQKNKD
ncbi:Uncharacterised protein [BD1-7 clade bacterium]|uniref:Transcriptional regulator n=1 Tax=BD1-7 clade bacterium TaxID=2029982 RepID=A0A5S9Q228_9GAMM|nr:Uncharacterised protein [BD1-7 clade bacterium]CAA0111868.1 Uncharacterised protein [BD1-7 clade bacterium]